MLCFAGVWRGVQQSNKSIPENFTQLGVGKLLAPLSEFLSFFSGNSSGNVSHRLYSSVSYCLRLMRVPPQEFVVSPAGGQ